ncbi:MAG: hypothetical protein PUJ79_04195 [Helicobacter sp.]|nr:hypothetical protein [Helicobacter sp.]MDY5740218.1 hypothetical protein [Helicobacter sp.]
MRASSQTDIAKLCALFSKDFLFALRTQDINIINEPFYHELLYLLGLEEQERNGKILIVPSVESKDGKTLYYAIITKPTEWIFLFYCIPFSKCQK